MKTGYSLLVTLFCFWLFSAHLSSSAAPGEETSPGTLALPQPDDPAATACAPVKSSGSSGGAVTLHRSFFDDFLGTALDLRKWQTHLEGDGNRLSNRTLTANHEKEIYVDSSFAGIGLTPLKLNPFVLKNGILSIIVDRTSTELRSRLYDQPFTSGVITTVGSFRQTYGYFEIRAKVPRGKGLWPAFWLLQPKWHWPPEIDILEGMKGQRPEEITLTTHWKENGVGPHKFSYCLTTVNANDTGLHLYGALWTATRIVYYIDRKPVVQMLTPPGLDQPMYMIANLAAQSTADEATPTPASFDIDWIAAYSL
jgi:beta-glucanase (GH16 family)